VEHDLRPEAAHHLVHAVHFLAVGEDRLATREVTLFDQLPLDLEQAVLGVIDHHQKARMNARDLPAELRADRATRAGDENGPVVQVRAGCPDLELYRLAAENVLDLYLTHLAHQVHRAGDELEHARKRSDGNVTAAARAHDLAADFTRGRRDRDDDLVRGDVVEHLLELARRAKYLEVEDAHAALARVVVHEADRGLTELGASLHLLRDELSGFAATDDQDLRALR
jgi:hypothetical protein